MDLILGIIILIDLIFAIGIVFFERRNPESALAWLAVLACLPVFGFLLYIAFGQNYYRSHLFRLKAEDDRKLQDRISDQLRQISLLEQGEKDERIRRYMGTMQMLLLSNHAIITDKNRVEIYTSGEAKFRSLFEAIRNAKQYIHLEYYYINADRIGSELAALLTEKAREGVEVKVLVDGLPFVRVPKKLWEPLIEAGGKHAVFFPGLFGIIHLRFNNRNHRKLAVIDGKIGFCGGYNVGDENLGREWLGFWRDTHVRVEGPGALALELRFLQDWNYATGDTLEWDPVHFPEVTGEGTAYLQVVSSGPDNRYNQVKEAYLKLINIASESVYIQTPYFVPDVSITDALRLAALSGIDVRIMIPWKPDFPLVYEINHAHVADLLEAGVKAYEYRKEGGYIHAKTIVVDGMIASVGSANWDVRSFRLNFETNVLIYDQTYAQRLKEIYEEDLKESSQITRESLEKRPWRARVWESVARLFSPIL
ncbi:MAG: cardiolipin synthase [Methanomicrobiales archaeon]|nr:cardiolipin synthase [Methanomicrobiales archaeon]MDD1659233.1 cardiolipin synthase [Methanomicrobiales archaeon]